MMLDLTLRENMTTKITDQAGTVHQFDFDKLGRQTQDCVTTLGNGMDGAVRRISSTYEVRGIRESVTSYDSAIRPTTVTYPNGRVVTYAYDSSNSVAGE
jgi:hypothetical protein